jgi:hypothetical protein
MDFVWKAERRPNGRLIGIMSPESLHLLIGIMSQESNFPQNHVEKILAILAGLFDCLRQSSVLPFYGFATIPLECGR